VDYRTLGYSGCAVSAFALGTMTFGVETEEAEAHRQLDRFRYGEMGAEQRGRRLAGGR
jgi:aryl-alcohol dehydrogenase-like predicted oxidoreductase